MHVGGRTLQVCGQVGLEPRLAIDRVEAEQSRFVRPGAEVELRIPVVATDSEQ